MSHAALLVLTTLLLATPAAFAAPVLPDVGDLCDNMLCGECPVTGSCELPDAPRAPKLPAIPCFGPYTCELPLS